MVHKLKAVPVVEKKVAITARQRTDYLQFADGSPWSVDDITTYRGIEFVYSAGDPEDVNSRHNELRRRGAWRGETTNGLPPAMA